MLKWLISNKKKSNNTNLQYNSKIVGPFGKYAWAIYDVNTPSIDGGNEARLYLGQTDHLVIFSASSHKLEREACIILATYTSPSLFIAPMVLNNHIKPKQKVYDWLVNYGKEKSIVKFGCWPLTDFSSYKILQNLNPKSLFLYGYLAPLSKKKTYILDNTPKSIKQYLSGKELQEAYDELSSSELIKEASVGKWIHSTVSEAIETRNSMTNAVRISNFVYSTELMTKSIMRDIEACRKLGRKLVSKRQPNRENNCPCPICVKLPNKRVELSLDSSILHPFHYDCGHWRPQVEMK